MIKAAPGTKTVKITDEVAEISRFKVNLGVKLAAQQAAAAHPARLTLSQYIALALVNQLNRDGYPVAEVS